jgi:hypothetical protein
MKPEIFVPRTLVIFITVKFVEPTVKIFVVAPLAVPVPDEEDEEPPPEPGEFEQPDNVVARIPADIIKTNNKQYIFNFI